MKICRVCQGQYPDDVMVCPEDKTDLHSTTNIAAGTVLAGKYEIVSKVGEGGMGAVFKAKQLSDGGVCALKVVAERLVQEAGFRQRFKSEALIMGALDHPNDVRIREYGETEAGIPFTVMEFVDGVHLDELQPKGSKMDMARAVNLIAQLLDGLSAAHKLGFIHRDVKPDNILVGKDANGKETVKLLDFGVAKVKEHGDLYATSKTAAGVMIGTPAYMSPEQVKGIPSDQLDGRVDLYAAGVILYELLCGRAPFVEKKPVMMLMAHAASPVPDPKTFRKDMPPALAAVLLKVLEKDPTKRFADAAEMRAALDAAMPGAAPPPAVAKPAAAPAAAAAKPVAPAATPAQPAAPPSAAPPAARPGAPLAANPPAASPKPVEAPAAPAKPAGPLVPPEAAPPPPPPKPAPAVVPPIAAAAPAPPAAAPAPPPVAPPPSAAAPAPPAPRVGGGPLVNLDETFAAPSTGPAAPSSPASAPPAAAPPAPRPSAQPGAPADTSDPDITAELAATHEAPVPRLRIPMRQPAPPPNRSSYAGEMPKARGVVQHKATKRHWGRVVVVWTVIAAIFFGVLWLLLGAEIKKISGRLIGRDEAAVAKSIEGGGASENSLRAGRRDLRG